MLAEVKDRGEVRVFGPFRVADASGRRLRFEARSADALCAYLAARWRGVSRAEVAETLWPSAEHDAARASLRTAVYRVRRMAGEDAIRDESGRLSLALASDAHEAARLRRDRQRASDADRALASAKAEWSIVRRPLLEGWEDAWVEPLRDDAQILANECGTALARLYEERGDLDGALDALDGVLGAVPYHMAALEQAMRLEHALHGRERALARIDEARAHLGDETGLTLPGSVRRLERTIREGVAGFIPPPVAFSDGADLALIGHMLENSLRQGDGTGLRLLAEQAFSPVCVRQPHRTLDLLRRAIEYSEGFGPDRCAAIKAAIGLALNLPAVDLLHGLCDMLIAEFPPGDRLRSGSLLVKGGAYLNAKELALARQYTERAVEEESTEERRIVAGAQLGAIDWHEARFEASLERILPAIDALASSAREDRFRNMSALCEWACLAHLARGTPAEAVAAGEASASIGDAGSIGERHSAAPLGLAYVADGRSTEGVERLRYALRETYRARLRHGFVMAVESSALALGWLGRSRVAQSVFEAATVMRRAEGVPRSPGELHLVRTWGRFSPSSAPHGPLRLQTQEALVEWVDEALQGVL